MMNDVETRSDQKPSLCFVNCIESGPMEQQAVMLAESIQRWGGKFADCNHYMVMPRLSAPIANRTKDQLEKLGVNVVRINPQHKATWYANLNKATALKYVEEIASEEMICWLDTDILVIDEPIDLELEDGVDFKAMPASTRHDIGVDQKTQNHSNYWKKFCQALELVYEELPTIPSQEREHTEMKMYWQGGVFCYRRICMLGAMHQKMFLQRLANPVASVDSGVYFYDQTSLALAVWQKKLKWKTLNMHYNFALNKLRSGEWSVGEFGSTRVIHYFGSMWPDAFEQLIDFVEMERPDVAEFLRFRGPLENRLGWWQRLFNRCLNFMRKRKFRKFELTAVAY